METEKKKMKRKIRLKTKDVLFQLPPDLHNSIKAELRSQGISFTSWIISQMIQAVKEGPIWRAFLKEQAQRPEAQERGFLHNARGRLARELKQARNSQSSTKEGSTS